MTEGGAELDYESVPRLIDHCAAAGCAGCLVAAVAGEQGSLSVEEHEQLVSAVVIANSGRLSLVVACSAAEQDDRMRKARLCSRLGIQCVCVQVPGEAESAAERLRLLSDVAQEALPAVLMLQDLDFSGPGLAVEEIVSLFGSIGSMKALKIEAAPAGPKYSAVLEATGGRLHLSGGWAVQQMLEALARYC